VDTAAEIEEGERLYRSQNERQQKSVDLLKNISFYGLNAPFLPSLFPLSTVPRETREGWPLLTVETAVSRDSKSTNEWGPSLFG
jgi:hypothetical protein